MGVQSALLNAISPFSPPEYVTVPDSASAWLVVAISPMSTTSREAYLGQGIRLLLL